MIGTPPADQAAIVFMRQVRAATSTSLFELRGQPDRFMVIGQSASFMDAEVQAGKTYYVAVGPGDLAQEQFVFRPLRPADLEMPDIRECLASCVWVEDTEKSQAWARWESRTTRPTLSATDGR